MAKTIYYTKEGLSERIKEIREMICVFQEREDELITLYTAIKEHNGYLIDNLGKLLKLGEAKRQTTYSSMKARDKVFKFYRSKIGLKNNPVHNSLLRKKSMV